MKKYNVLLLSNFGYYTGVIGGQTIKAQNLYETFLNKKDNFGFDLKYFDTSIFNKKNAIIINIFILFFRLIKSNVLIFAGSKNNLKYLFPFFYLFCKIFNIKIHYVVVGGWLDDFLEKNLFYVRLLKNIEGIYPENIDLCNRLTTIFNFKNVTQLYNFRVFDKKLKKSIKKENEIFKFVFMARVTPEKGVDTLFKLAEALKSKCDFTIDIYGPLDDKYKSKFEKEISDNLSYITYKGIVNPSNVYAVLNQYDCMLFPTRYPGEGFPGTVLDSYISGIPIIASNWQYASELILHGKSGLIAEYENDQDFIEHVFSLIHNYDLLKKLSNGASEESKKYSSENAWSILAHNIFNRELN